MDEPALSIKTVCAGPVCTLVLSGDLDLSEAERFLEQAALAVDDRTERLVLDLAGLTFLDCAGVRALSMAMSFAPAGCPVIIRSLSPAASRILDLLDLDLEHFRNLAGLEPEDGLQPQDGLEPHVGLWDQAVSSAELAPVEPGDPDVDA
jgi:anti-anti-sigma factor